jgi:lipase maturation factor
LKAWAEAFHAFTTLLTLVAELGLVWMMFLPRRWRIICFFIVTPFQVGIILTANYTFLNYLVLSLGFLLLDDRFLRSLLPRRWKQPSEPQPEQRRQWSRILWLSVSGVCLSWVLYVTTALMFATIPHGPQLPRWPIRAAEPFRIANSYGLFATMTHARYEIEFQGWDGKTWIKYPFRYKPQDPYKKPGIYAPYQPRFDWNLWFASLGSWRENTFVLQAEARLLQNQPDVLELFASNPFPKEPPLKVRSVIWQYWFTDWETRRKTGAWWRAELLGQYTPSLIRTPDGQIEADPSEIQQPQIEVKPQ